MTTAMTAQTVTKIRNADRTKRCASCRAVAAFLLCIDGKPYYSTCLRHLALNERRAGETK